MKEIYEFRIFKDKYPLLATDKGICKGPIYILQIAKTDPLFNKIGEIEQYLRKKNPIEFLFSFWSIHRSYTEKELSKATLFQFKIKTLFEPCGEECGTVYDEMAACPLCGANRK